jgi:hypothetical protein
MSRSLFLSSIIGGVIAFIWGFVSWMVVPWHSAHMHRFDDPEAVVETLAQNAPADGIYVYNPKEMLDDSSGTVPFVFASINRTHAQHKPAVPLIRSLVFQVVAAFFVSWILIRIKSRKYWDLVTISALIGLISAILSDLPAWNWWGIPGTYAIIGLLDAVIGWFLAGLGMARIIEKVKTPR